MSSLHFQGEITKINIWLQLLKHKSKRLQTTQAQKQEVSYAQAHTQETSYAQAQKQETSKKHNYTENCLRLNTWYTINDVHNTNQINTLKTLEFLRYESC